MKPLFLATIAAFALTTPAHADTRSLMYLKGAAYAIVAKCPTMKVNHNPKLYRGWGTRRGNLQEFTDGVFLIAEIWGKKMIDDDESSVVDCHNVCDETRSGTCNFVKEGKYAE